jgi:hypothetical protein
MDQCPHHRTQVRQPAWINAPQYLSLASRVAIILLIWALTKNAQVVAGYIPIPTACNFTESTGQDIHTFLWTLEEQNSWLLTSEGDSEVHRVWLDSELNTYKWTLERPEGQTTITASTEENRLLLEGTLNGKLYKKEFSLGDVPWYQALSLSLRKHLGEEFKEQEFWSIRPDNFDVHKMQIIKISEENLDSDGIPLPTYHVIVRPAGWKAPFWKGEYWFRKSDGQFVRYRGDSGPPGCPDTIIELGEELRSHNPNLAQIIN